MKSKRLFQLFVLLALVFSPFGNSQRVSASTNSVDQLDPIVIPRDLSIWNATYAGFVSSSIYEKWQFTFDTSHNFVVTVTTVTGDLVPLLTLLDSNGNEITHATGSLTSIQPAGNYFIQVQPQSGSGVYFLTLREILIQSSASVVVSPTSVDVGGTATGTVSLNNVPAGGYTSAEFTCTYNASLVEVSNILAGNLFGADPALAINGPQNGTFIVAIAGSNGNKATTSGVAFTFSVKGLQAGQTAINCTVKVSTGNNVLTTISSSGASLTVNPTITQTNTPTSTSTATGTPPTNTPTPTSTVTGTPPTNTPTPTSTATGTPPTNTPTSTSTATGTPPTNTPTPTSTATSTAIPQTLTGQVLVPACKQVRVSLNDAGNNEITSGNANPNGTFTLMAAAGTYTAIAKTAGFLSASGPATVPGSMPTVTLIAGDIDGDGDIDQFDAITIGINYGQPTPAEADLNCDQIINVLDLEILAAHYRATGPTPWQ